MSGRDGVRAAERGSMIWMGGDAHLMRTLEIDEESIRDVTKLPEPMRRKIYDAFRLEIAYDLAQKRPRMALTIFGEVFNTLAALATEAINCAEDESMMSTCSWVLDDKDKALNQAIEDALHDGA